jgi:hypothetical protein
MRTVFNTQKKKEKDKTKIAQRKYILNPSNASEMKTVVSGSPNYARN